jgi:lysophospholipase L1-like esterase
VNTTSNGGVANSGGTTSNGGVANSGGTTSSGGVANSGGTTSNGGSTTLANVTVYLAGDSIVTNYKLATPNDVSDKEWAGWGQMLSSHFNTKVTVNNQAVGGMTARHFIQAGNLDTILKSIKSGDYLLLQFGTNDSNKTATYTIDGTSYPYFASTTDFKTYLQEYIDGAKAKGATPVLVTPPPRNSAYCSGGRSMADYATAMEELGAAQKVPVVNLSMKTWNYLSAICPAPASAAAENFFRVYTKNSVLTVDGTHFQESGARKLADFVAEGLRETGAGLAAYLL